MTCWAGWALFTRSMLSTKGTKGGYGFVWKDADRTVALSETRPQVLL